MKPVALFEYTCPECGLGTVRTTTVLNYKTRIKGYPFIVDEAFIGVCNNCGTESFAPEETKRWEDLFLRSLGARQAFLSPEEITEVRTTLGLSMEDFARLIGSTRQSLSTWEKLERSSPPARMADLMMKLVRQSVPIGSVDVIAFLLEEAKKWGVVIEIRKPTLVAEEQVGIVLRPKRVLRRALPDQARELTLAAEAGSEDEEVFALETLEGKYAGKLEFDYERAALVLAIVGSFPRWKAVDVEIETNDGRRFTQTEASIREQHLVLKEKMPLRERDIARIMLSPSREKRRQ